MKTDDQGKSKTQLKREFQALNSLASELVKTANGTLKRIGLSEELHGAITNAKSMQRGALRRQLKLITAMLAANSPDKIKRALTREVRPHHKQVAAFHEVERWRDALIGGDEELFEKLVTESAEIDRQQLRQLVRNARQEDNERLALKSARALFQYLSAIHAKAG